MTVGASDALARLSNGDLLITGGGAIDDFGADGSPLFHGDVDDHRRTIVVATQGSRSAMRLAFSSTIAHSAPGKLLGYHPLIGPIHSKRKSNLAKQLGRRRGWEAIRRASYLYVLSI